MAGSRLRIVGWLFAAVGVIVAVIVGISFRDRWLPMLVPDAATAEDSAIHSHESERTSSAANVLELSPQARQNLGLKVRPLKLDDYWRKILIPGEIVDRPGVSDRGITAPAVAVVTRIHAFPGDTVRPGDPLFTLRLLSEYIQNSQSELFKTTRETQLIQEQRNRLAKAAEGGALPQARLIELDQQMQRAQASIQAYRQDLLTRGLTPEQLAEVVEGRFVATIEVTAPPVLASAKPGNSSEPATESEAQSPQAASADFKYEVQELKVDLGTQVQAGQALAVLANHRFLYVAGHAFKREAPYLERAAQQGWPIDVEFTEDDPSAWPNLNQTFAIRHLANSIDSTSRTFEFFIPLMNQSRSYEQDGRQFVVWRFRPGQRVRLHVPVAEMKDVIVLPSDAIVREGPEVYVFRQNGDLFDRLPVHVLHEDRRNVVLANDGSVWPGWFIAQGSAASLNRVLKSQSASGVPAGVHVHADGTVHGAH